MVSRTRIPLAMYETGYTPSTPSGVVTPAAMTKDGSGEPIKKDIIQDYPCGSEPGHSFRSSPLNIYAIGRDSSVVLYVEGGCPNFTWESDNEWATFETAETSVRYNTITSSADEGQDTIVTVTDANGLEVTISVPYSGASTCCEDVPIEFALQTDRDEIVLGGDTVIFLDGGCSPFTWEVDDEELTLANAATNSRRNKLTASGDATKGTLTVTDLCEASVTACLCFDPSGFGYDTENSGETVDRSDSAEIFVEGGCPPFTWAVAGTDFSFDDETTSERQNTLNAGASACGTATVTVTDDCGDEVTGYVRCTYGVWALKSSDCQLSGDGELTGSAGELHYYQLIQGNKKQLQTSRNSVDLWCYSWTEEDVLAACEIFNAGDCGADSPDNCIDPDHEFPGKPIPPYEDCLYLWGANCWCVYSLSYYEWECP